jgi:hypothetical protein
VLVLVTAVDSSRVQDGMLTGLLHIPAPMPCWSAEK